MQPISTSGNEIDDLIEWLREELRRTQYGKVGLLFTVHQNQITGIERTTSIHGKFVLSVGADGGD